jgi:hypothetical protein
MSSSSSLLPLEEATSLRLSDGCISVYQKEASNLYSNLKVAGLCEARWSSVSGSPLSMSVATQMWRRDPPSLPGARGGSCMPLVQGYTFWLFGRNEIFATSKPGWSKRRNESHISESFYHGTGFFNNKY